VVKPPPRRVNGNCRPPGALEYVCPSVFVGYGRDHDRQVGAGMFTAKLGAAKILFQRVPDLNGPMQQRFLRNALSWLCG
jgi:hypothetical protein